MQANKEKEIIQMLGHEVKLSSIDNPQLRKAIISRFNSGVYAHSDYHTDGHTDEYEYNQWGKEVHSDYNENSHRDYDDSN